MRTFVWPGHAYIPGVTARHPQNLFDEVRDTASDDMSPAELAACDAWLSGQGYIKAGYFWEAREVWEPVAAALPVSTVEGVVAQAAMELANAGLRLRMDEIGVARKHCDLAEAYLLGLQGSVMGLPMSWFAEHLLTLRSEIDAS